MKLLQTPYRCSPPDAKCYYRNDGSLFYHTLHQKNLHLCHFLAGESDLLSVILLCRTLALPGDWHRRENPDFLNISYIHSGETNFRIGDESFLAEKGDLVLLPPGTDYEFGTRKESIRSGILIKGPVIDTILRHFAGRMVFSGDPGTEEKIERFFRKENEEKNTLSLLCFDLLSSLVPGKRQVKLPSVVGNALRIMKTHLAEDLPLDLIAERSGVTPRTLNRLFRKSLRISPHQYLKKLRMEKACQMLSMEEFSIKEIASLSGYPNALNFSTEFRRSFGCSPTKYRKKRDER